MTDFYIYLQKQAEDSPEAGHTLRNLLAMLTAGGTALATHKLQPGIARGIGRQGAASWKSLLNTLSAKFEPAGKSVASQLAGMTPKLRGTEKLDRRQWAGPLSGPITRKPVDDLMDKHQSYLKNIPISKVQEYITNRDTATPYFKGLRILSPFAPGSKFKNRSEIDNLFRDAHPGDSAAFNKFMTDYPSASNSSYINRPKSHIPVELLIGKATSDLQSADPVLRGLADLLSKYK